MAKSRVLQAGRQVTSDGLEIVLAEALRRLDEEKALLDQEELNDWRRSVVNLQWHVADEGMYNLVGDTVSAIPPGMYSLNSSQGVIYFTQAPVRTDKILRFPSTPTDEVVGEIQKFWEREDIFRRFSLPFKRGILLYGPPGSGKTCTIQLVARDVIARGGIVLVYDSNLFVGAYRQLRMVQPETPIVVLMEDIDSILDRGDESKILNTLDGAENIDRAVFLASTNYPERLGARIVNRPSRFDRRFKIAHPDRAGRRIYLESLVEDGNAEDIDVDAMIRDTDGLSLAHVKELFVATVLLDSPYSATVETLKRMREKESSAYDEDTSIFENGYA